MLPDRCEIKTRLFRLFVKLISIIFQVKTMRFSYILKSIKNVKKFIRHIVITLTKSLTSIQRIIETENL